MTLLRNVFSYVQFKEFNDSCLLYSTLLSCKNLLSNQLTTLYINSSRVFLNKILQMLKDV